MGKWTNIMLAAGAALVLNEMVEKDEQGKRSLNPDKLNRKARELGAEAKETLDAVAEKIKDKAIDKGAQWVYTDAHRCAACGNALVQGAPFCANCGQAVVKEGGNPCPSCQADIAKGSKFCPYCGTAHLGAKPE